MSAPLTLTSASLAPKAAPLRLYAFQAPDGRLAAWQAREFYGKTENGLVSIKGYGFPLVFDSADSAKRFRSSRSRSRALATCDLVELSDAKLLKAGWNTVTSHGCFVRTHLLGIWLSLTPEQRSGAEGHEILAGRRPGARRAA